MSWGAKLISHAAGETFGKWRVIRRLTPEEVAVVRNTSRKFAAHWLCQCSGCGAERPVYGASLRSGASRSCGKGPCRRHA